MAEKTKRKFINFFDIAVLLVVAAVVFILFQLGVFGNTATIAAADNVRTVTYVIRLTPMRYGTEEKIQPGDELFESVQRTSVGTVVDVQCEDTKYYTYSSELGEYVVSYIEGDVTAYVTVQVDCIVSDSGFTAVDGQAIKSGDQFNVLGPGYFGFGTVVSIERGDGV